MIKFRLAPYLDTTWTFDGIGYVTADHASWIAPFRHELLEHLALTDGHRTLLVVRERLAGRQLVDPRPRRACAADYDRARTIALDWPADFVLVETAPAMPVRVTAGSSGIAPLYLADDARSLHGSWDMADLRSYARGLCAREAARLLLYRPRYGGETLFTGIRRLTERATAFFGGALYLHYLSRPCTAPHANWPQVPAC